MVLRFRHIVWALSIAVGCMAFTASASFAQVPSTLHVIDTSVMSDEQLAMIMSLQGVVAQRATDGSSQIWISGEIDPGLLNFVANQFNIHLIQETDPFALLGQFTSGLTGFEQYSFGLRSMNVAAPLAGVDKSVIASTAGIITTLTSPPLNLSLENDVTQNDESFWIGPRLSQLNRSLLIELGLLANGPRHLRDLSASRKVLTYTDGTFGTTTFRAAAMGLTNPHTNVLGFPQDGNDIEWIRAASRFQHPAVRADTAHDLSVLSGIGTGQTFSQPAASHTGPVATQNGVHYVCIVLDGGWDIGFSLDVFSHPNWFGNSRRGSFKMNWEISPALLDYAPMGLPFLYSQSDPTDFFVSAASGFGQLYPNQYKDLTTYAGLLGPKVKQSDLRVVNVLADTGGQLSDAEPIVDRPEVLGVFYKTNFSFYTGIPAGTFDVHSGKVIWPYRYALWSNGLPANTADGIATAIANDPHTSPSTDPLSYSLVAVFPTAFWDNNPAGSSIMDTVAKMVDELNQHAQVRIVSAEELAWLLRANFGDGRNGPLFPDVPTTFWAWEDIEALAKANLVQGFPDGTFQPTEPVDRGQMAIFVARVLAGGDASVPSGPAVPSFLDVAPSDMIYKYVEFCKRKNVVQGFGDRTYRPSVLVDRAQMAVFIARSLVAPLGDAGIPVASPTPVFPDVTQTGPAGFAFNHAALLAERGIVHGFPDGLYHPEIVVTRDQMAVFIARAFSLSPT